MRNELLKLLKLEDLQGEARELAETMEWMLSGGWWMCMAVPAGCTFRRRTN